MTNEKILTIFSIFTVARFPSNLFTAQILLEARAPQDPIAFTTRSGSFRHDKYVSRIYQLVKLLQFAPTICPSISRSSRLLRPDLLSEVIHRSLKNSQATSCLETWTCCLLLPLAFHLLRATELSVKSSRGEPENIARTVGTGGTGSGKGEKDVGETARKKTQRS